MFSEIEAKIKALASSEKAKILQGFFKTWKGQYWEGDIFIWVTVPKLRAISKLYKKATIEDISLLFQSPYHELRLTWLFILISQYEGKKTVDFYLDNIKYVNNWDLVDLSAHHILGRYLYDKDRSILYSLVTKDNLWERRIAIISTFYFIKFSDFVDSLKLAKISLLDKHDLMHKAVWWMLREIGKRNVVVLKDFLKDNYQRMPRTMLRYAIEKFSDEEKAKYLKWNI